MFFGNRSPGISGVPSGLAVGACLLTVTLSIRDAGPRKAQKRAENRKLSQNSCVL
jgi:hypothetical protein